MTTPFIKDFCKRAPIDLVDFPPFLQGRQLRVAVMYLEHHRQNQFTTREQHSL